MNVYDCKTATGPVENGRQVLTLAAVVSVSGPKGTECLWKSFRAPPQL